MKLIRMFSTASAKGTEGYLNTQKAYEIARTVLLFGISIALFAAGWLTTGTNRNILTIVAVLGCLPASKSAVSAVMFCRYKSLKQDICHQINEHTKDLTYLYDCVFTGYEKNYPVNHIVVKGKTVCGFSEDPKFDSSGFQTHINRLLNNDSHKDVSVKIFTNLDKYLERLDQMKELSCDESSTLGIVNTLKSVSL